MKSEVVKTRNSEIQIDEQGLCHQKYDENSRVSLEDTLEECRIIWEMAGSESIPILVDITNVKYISRESRVYFGSKDAEKIFKAAALLVGNQTSRVLGNFFIGLNKTVMPVKLFTSDSEALMWLMDIHNKEVNE